MYIELNRTFHELSESTDDNFSGTPLFVHRGKTLAGANCFRNTVLLYYMKMDLEKLRKFGALPNPYEMRVNLHFSFVLSIHIRISRVHLKKVVMKDLKHGKRPMVRLGYY